MHDDGHAQPRALHGVALYLVHQRGALRRTQTGRRADAGHVADAVGEMSGRSTLVETRRRHEVGDPHATELGNLLGQRHLAQQVLDTIYDRRTELIPLVFGLREYLQTLTQAIRIPVGDGTLMAAFRDHEQNSIGSWLEFNVTRDGDSVRFETTAGQRRPMKLAAAYDSGGRTIALKWPNFDRVVVLQAGRIVQDGPPDQLLRHGGQHRDLMRRQMGPPIMQVA